VILEDGAASEVSRYVATPCELSLWPPGLSWATYSTLLFSAKESIFQMRLPSSKADVLFLRRSPHSRRYGAVGCSASSCSPILRPSSALGSRWRGATT
jgi:4'-phosphopantetheinyl transferase EntD